MDNAVSTDAAESGRAGGLLIRAARFVCNLAISGAALGCGAAAIAAQGGRWNDRLDLLTHFAPVWLVAGLTLSVIAIVLQRGWWQQVSLGLALAAVGSAGALMAVDLPKFPRADAPITIGQKPLKIIEFNAWVRNSKPTEIVDWLALQNPDVVVLVEPTPELERMIEARTGLHVFVGSGAAIAMREQPLSVHVAWEVHTFPGHPTEFTWVELPAPGGGTYTVVGVHCGWPIPSWYAWGQDRRIASFLATEPRNQLILTGDFNSTQWSFRQRAADKSFGLERRDRAMPTWPARLPQLGGRAFPAPFLSIDHLYAGSRWRTVKVERGPSLGSDHYPLVATLAWVAPGRATAAAEVRPGPR